MIRLMISGKLHDAPQSRESSKGTTYTVAKVKADDKSGLWVWVSVIAFGNESERLLSLKAGDAVSIAGPAEINAWLDKEGNPKPSVSMVAEQLISLRPKPRPVDAERPPVHRSRRTHRIARPQEEHDADDGEPFNDLDDWQP